MDFDSSSSNFGAESRTFIAICRQCMVSIAHCSMLWLTNLLVYLYTQLSKKSRDVTHGLWILLYYFFFIFFFWGGGGGGGGGGGVALKTFAFCVVSQTIRKAHVVEILPCGLLDPMILHGHHNGCWWQGSRLVMPDPDYSVLNTRKTDVIPFGSPWDVRGS